MLALVRDEAQLWYFVSKIVLNTGRKICSSDRDKLFKVDAGGQELENFLRSLQHFFSNSERSVQTIFETECVFNFFLEVSEI